MTEHVNVVVPRHTQCGEGPYWDPESRTVVWVDIIGKQALRTAIGCDTTVIDYPEMVGAAAPRVGGGLVLAVESGFALLDATGEVTSWVDVLTPPLRMNDAKVDPAGRYWAGACAMDFSEGKGGLWRLDENLSAELVLDGLTQPNGIGWSPDGTTMYLAETQARQLLSYGFDPVTSSILSGPSVVAEGFADYPDGLCVDRDGHIWLAEYGGGVVHEITPDGDVVRSIRFDTPQTTSCAFVGDDLDTLLVTTAGVGLDPETDPIAGSLLEITGHGTAGLAVALFKG